MCSETAVINHTGATTTGVQLCFSRAYCQSLLVVIYILWNSEDPETDYAEKIKLLT